MMLRIGNRTFDYWDFGHSGVEHRPGLVVILARYVDGKAEIVDAAATTDMYDSAEHLAETGRLRGNEPGVRLGLLTYRTSRADAAHIAAKLMRSRWVNPVETDGRELRPTLSSHDLAEL